LGHPPFGHAGERTLHRLMKEYGGFEGNAQTLRILTETIYRTEDSRKGMNPCRAFLDSTLKYKSLFGKLDNPVNHYLYDFQKQYLDFVFEGFDLHEKYEHGEEVNSFRSIECQIMDWADDTAYAINDILDSVIGGFISIEKLVNYGKENSLQDNEAAYLDELIELIKAGGIKPKLGSQIGDFIQSCSIEERETFMDGKTNRYKFVLKIDESCAAKANFFKTLAVKMVFRSSQLHQMEFKGDFMLTKFFETLKENYIDRITNVKLLPEFNHRTIVSEKDEKLRARLVCDYLAGMTDSFAIRSYRRLFDPNFSALADLV
jgi:dGTPase